MHNWFEFQEEICTPASALLRSLSVSQLNSLRLLLEWWTAQYDDIEKTAKMINSLERHASSPLYTQRYPHGFVSEQGNGENYHYNLACLFEMEFAMYRYEGVVEEDVLDWRGLQDRRALAARIAACQRLAYCVYRFHSPLANRAVASKPLQEVISSSANGLPVGGTIEACAWLPESQKNSLPYYLWDVEKKQTIVVHELSDNHPVYVVISHTWGRWVLPEAGTALVPGVPWDMPKNSRFDIEALPNTLYEHQSVFAPAKLVWFDLLCIPQDRSPRAKEEIAKQAAIFGGAYRAFAWLNYIESWAGLSYGLQYMFSKYLDRVNDNRTEGATIRSAIESKFCPETYLFNGFEGTESDWEYDEEGGWFTSLWTLQEVFLRSDMLLCNRDWVVFRATEAHNEPPMSLDCILATHHVFLLHCLGKDDRPGRPVYDIIALFQTCELDQTLQLNPISPLLLGSRRQCTARRAEAIMSVVGATEWYRNSDYPSNDADLVLGRYPIAFLRELHRLFGARLFSSLYLHCCYEDVFHRDSNGSFTYGVAGTMLPFDGDRELSKSVVQIERGDMIDHPTTNSWHLGADGRLFMPNVSIMASTDDRLNQNTDPDIVAMVILPAWTQEDKSWDMVHKITNLREAILTAFPGYTLAKHAVCLRIGSKGFCEGVILMAVPHDQDDPPTFYAKIGDFSIADREDLHEYDITGSQNVTLDEAWEVL
jgi:hypothetical protein